MTEKMEFQYIEFSFCANERLWPSLLSGSNMLNTNYTPKFWPKTSNLNPKICYIIQLTATAMLHLQIVAEVRVAEDLEKCWRIAVRSGEGTTSTNRG